MVETVCVPHSLRYLLSCSLQKTFSDLCSKTCLILTYVLFLGFLLNIPGFLWYFHSVWLELICLPFIKSLKDVQLLATFNFSFPGILCKSHVVLLCVQNLVSSRRLWGSPLHISGAFSLGSCFHFGTLAHRFQPPYIPLTFLILILFILK